MYIAFLALGDGGVHLEGGETKTSFAYSKPFFYPLFASLVTSSFLLSCILAKSLHDEMMKKGNRRERQRLGNQKAKRMNGTIE